ncbi:hypothetical protein A1351_05475 [Methylosinus sp. R-45379]|jgi:phosphate-selective porin OprO/OprP|uniref:OprO/OprP family phosphate-selective porin n=1 Tax=unclassified Methylosinus TaxID=2624500 RepID=UPI00068B70FE|nr:MULTISPECIES: porin [unclassified Methylosinus]OAI31321.1 hypothetical protein A1351_05475 [Methylosinus sp. R-45379]TDX62174.1 phosphate-selective porin OprO/OprP [Methylosinus sp. sav-2]
MTQVPNVQTIAKGATPSKLLGGVAVLALGAFGAPTAALADTQSEIKALKAELKRLEHKLDEQAKTTHQVKNALNSAKAAPGGNAPPPVFVSFKNGLFVETEDQAFNFKIGGRIQADGGFTSYPSASGSRSNVGFRRARLEVEGKAYKNWYYKFQYDFTGTGVTGIRDAFIAYRDKLLPESITKQPITIQIGSQYEPFSMETLTSSKHITFIERALPGALAPDRHVGAKVGLGDKHWSVQAGVFSTSFGQDSSQAPAATGHQYWDLTTRATYAPIIEEDKLLHFGGSFMFHKPNDSTAAQDPNNLLPGTGSRDETDILNNRYIVVPSAQALNCSPTFKAATGLALLTTPGYLQNGCLKSSYNYNFEMAATYGPFSVQGEYSGAHYERDAGTAALLGNNGGSSLNYSGYYVQGSVFLTGESRAASYKGYDKDWNTPGTFGDVAIKNPLNKGGLGAWEFAARYSELNLNNGGLVDSNYAYLAAVAGNAAQQAIAKTATLGGREENLTLALNWYPVRGVRFQANWTRAMTLVAPSDKPYLNGQHPSTFLARAQVFW